MYKTYSSFSVSKFSFHCIYGKIGKYVGGDITEYSAYSLLINPNFFPANSVLVSPNSVLVSPNSVLVSPNSDYFVNFFLAKTFTDNCADYPACNIHFHSPEKIVQEVNHQYILSDNFLQGRHLNQVLIKIKIYE